MYAEIFYVYLVSLSFCARLYLFIVCSTFITVYTVNFSRVKPFRNCYHFYVRQMTRSVSGSYVFKISTASGTRHDNLN